MGIFMGQTEEMVYKQEKIHFKYTIAKIRKRIINGN